MAHFVPYAEREGYQLNNVPASIRRRLIQRARRHNTSVANVVGEILAARYGIPFEPSPRRNPPAPWVDGAGAGQVSFRLPVDVMERIRMEALAANVTQKSVMLNAMYDEFRLKRPNPQPLPGKRPGRRKEK